MPRIASSISPTASQAPGIVHAPLTRLVREECDTFYSAPGFDSLYIYTRLQPPTGLLKNWPGALTVAQQQEVADDLEAARTTRKRVCIVRQVNRTKEWEQSSYGNGPLGRSLAAYQRRVAFVPGYSVSLFGSASDTGAIPPSPSP